MAEKAHTPWSPKVIADAKNGIPSDSEVFSCFDEASVPYCIRQAAEDGKYGVTLVIENNKHCFGRLTAKEISRSVQAYFRLCKIEVPILLFEIMTQCSRSPLVRVF